MKTRDLLEIIEQNGWMLHRMKGSHRQYKNPTKPQLRTITVSGHPSDEVPKGTLNAILKQAGLTK